MFQESFKGVSRKFQECFKEVSRVFKEVSRVFHGSFKVVSRIFQGCFKTASEVSDLSCQTPKLHKDKDLTLLWDQKILRTNIV